MNEGFWNATAIPGYPLIAGHFGLGKNIILGRGQNVLIGARASTATLIAQSELLEDSLNKYTLKVLVLGVGEVAIGDAGEPRAGLGVSTTIKSSEVEDGGSGLPGWTLRREKERDQESAARVSDPASDESSSSGIDAADVWTSCLSLLLRLPDPEKQTS